MPDADLRSFLAIPAEHPFPIQNLPYGVFLHEPTDVLPHPGVAIGDDILDLWQLEEAGLVEGAFAGEITLNAFLAAGRDTWGAVRTRLQRLLSADDPTLRDNEALRRRVLIPRKEATMLLPVEIGDYTDFYSSRDHATNLGVMIRGKENALNPNWLHLPVGYHGRASSIVVSGTDLRRPHGQMNPKDEPRPSFGPSRMLDFELEVGFFIGPGNELGRPIPIDRAMDHIFGLVLVNDWSARDIQRWEYVPLGPFLAKNFGTSISPWIVPMAALEPFRIAGEKQDPEPLSYLRLPGNWAYDINLEVKLQTAKMKEPAVISRSNVKHLYWNFCQQLAHHTVNGCPLRPGDLLASGTISGPTPDSLGSLIELAWRGTRPLQLPSGETRVFLEDGDRVTLCGYAQGPGYRVGLGEVTGAILPAGQ
jgi:fumarylacetoacetase